MSNQKHATPSRSLNLQPISNLSMHTGRRESQWLPGKYLHSVNIGTNGSNGGVRIRPPRATMMVSPPIIDESDVISRDTLLCHPPIYPEVRPKARNRLLGGFSCQRIGSRSPSVPILERCDGRIRRLVKWQKNDTIAVRAEANLKRSCESSYNRLADQSVRLASTQVEYGSIAILRYMRRITILLGK